jgi:hypothetical protein
MKEAIKKSKKPIAQSPGKNLGFRLLIWGLNIRRKNGEKT